MAPNGEQEPMCSEEGIHMCVVCHGVLEPKLGGKCFLVRGWLNKESEPKWVEEGINVGLVSDGDGKLVTQREIDQMSTMGAWFLTLSQRKYKYGKGED